MAERSTPQATGPAWEARSRCACRCGKWRPDGRFRDPKSTSHDPGVTTACPRGVAGLFERAETALSSSLLALPGATHQLATVATSSEGSTGFDTCTRKPARSARVRSSERANAVSAIAGILPPRRVAERAHAPQQLVAVDVRHADVAHQHVAACASDQHAAPPRRSPR